MFKMCMYFFFFKLWAIGVKIPQLNCHHNCFKNVQLTIALSFWDLHLNSILCLLCILYVRTTTLDTMPCILWFGILAHSWFIENIICILFVFLCCFGMISRRRQHANSIWTTLPILYGQHNKIKNILSCCNINMEKSHK